MRNAFLSVLAAFFFAAPVLAEDRVAISPDLYTKAELTACLSQQPSFAWLYLLRGFASG